MLRGADTIQRARVVPRQANPFPCPFRVEGLCQRFGGLLFRENLLLAHLLLNLRLGGRENIRGEQNRFRSETALLHLPDDLAGDIHTAEESAEVPG
jgi:hypothetical protein